MIETRITARADLDREIKKTYMNTIFATGDNAAHTVNVTVLRDGNEVSLTGASVKAYFIRYSDNATVILTGSASGNVVSVTMDKSCYNKTGQFALIIKVAIGSEISTVFFGEGSVYASITDIIIDPDNVIPSLEDLLAQIDAMEAGTAAANTAAGNANTATTYANAATTNANAATTNANAATTNANNAAAKIDGMTVSAHTLEPGNEATATISEKDGAKHIDFGLVKGNDGVYIGSDEPTDPTVQVWIKDDGVVDDDGYVVDLSPIYNGLDQKAPAIECDASGTLVMVDDAAALPVVSLISHIEPVQAGEGDPSLDNVRPISGVDSVTVNNDTSGQTLTATLPETVYGGTLDWGTGVLTVDREYVEIDGSMVSTYSSLGSGLPYVGISASRKLNNIENNIISDKYIGIIYNSVPRTNAIRAITDKIFIYDDRFVDEDTAKKILSEEKPQAVYKINTPYTIQLTPQQLETIKGLNNVWSDCGDTSLVYVADTKMYIDKKFDALAAAILS